MKLHCIYINNNNNNIYRYPPESSQESCLAVLSQYEQKKNIESLKIESNIPFTNHLPLLTSNCPAWICYAEKKYSEVLPYISKVMPPLQILGNLLKSKYGGKKIILTSIEPCYDKKLV